MKQSMVRIFLCLVMVVLTGCTEEIPKEEVIRAVRAIKVSDPTEFSKRWFPGQAKATQTVELSFQVAGPLSTRPVDIGDQVKKGQELARILPRDFQVALDKAKAMAVKAEEQYKRYRDLYTRKQVSKADFDQYRAEREVAKAKLEDAKNAMQDTRLIAPFDGIVTAIYVENYEDVQAKQPILRLIDHSRIEMVVNIPESMISSADQIQAAGNVMRVRFDPFPDSLIEARIKEIGKEASTTTRTYPVTLIMEQPEDIKILPGMAGNAASSLMSPKAAGHQSLVIPETAVFSQKDDGKTYVWIIDESSKKVSKREVVTAELMDTGIAVAKGLSPGDWIATAGVHYLKEGQTIRILSSGAREVAK
jgi:RND family efflux transporter MFP subunit